MAQNPHPLESASILGLLTISWVVPYIEATRKGLFEQVMHPKLPLVDSTQHNFDRLQRNEHFGQRTLLRTVISEYGGQFLLLSSTTAIRCILNGGISMMIYYFGWELERQAKQFQKVTEWQGLAKYVLGLIILTIGGMIMSQMADVERVRLSLRVRGSLSGLLFKKVERMGLINPSEHDEGTLTNNLQIDCERVCDSVQSLDRLCYDICNFLVTAIVGAYLFKPIFLLLIAGIAVIGAPLSFICCHSWWKVEYRWMGTKDMRLSAWKQLFGIIKFLKVMSWENAAYMRVELIRRKELKLQFFSFMIYGAFIFSIVAAPSLGTVGFLKYYFAQDYQLDIAKATIFLRLVLEVGQLVFGLPICLAFINELLISIERLNKVFEAPELSHIEVSKRTAPENAKMAVEITNSVFYWNDHTITDRVRDQTEQGGKTENHEESSSEKIQELIEPLLHKNTTKPEGMIELRENPQIEGTRNCFELTIDRFCLPRGKVTFVIGKIGSGKSSLLYAILGEMSVAKSSQLNIVGRIGYIGQKPWILNTTVKQNILLDKPDDPDRLQWALKYSALLDDIKTFPNGLDKETGENGGALSGGQKTRLALAQTLYQDPDIFMFDDILSALDSNVGSFIMEQTILQQLRGKTVLMTTHAVQYLPKGDFVHLMEDGKIEISGTFEDLQRCELYNRYLEMNKQFVGREKPAQNGTNPASTVGQISEMQPQQGSEQTTAKEFEENSPASDDVVVNSLMVPEDREVGNVSLKTFLTFFRLYGGPIGLPVSVLLCLLEQLVVAYKYFTITRWSQNFDTAVIDETLWKYFYLSMASSCLILCSNTLLCSFSYYLSRNIHARMVYSILHSRVETFLSRVPTGRILNRFSKDLQTVDQSLYWATESLWTLVSKVLVQVILYGFLLGKGMLVAILIMGCASVYLQRVYMGAKREFIRLHAISKTPMLNLFLDLCSGLPNIRCLEKSDWMRNQFFAKFDDCISNAIVLEGLTKWYVLRSGFIVLFLVVVPSYLFIMFGMDQLVLSEVMLTILVGTSMGNDVKEVLYHYSRLESGMISVERCCQFADTAAEPQYTSYKSDLGHADGSDASFKYLAASQQANTQQVVTKGHIVLKDVSCKYAVSSKPVLKNVSFEILPGQKVGVIGRTGSGKSTLIKLLWRTLGCDAGEILVDGQDISRVDLKSLRSQTTVVSQEVALFEGTLRENIDITHRGNSQDIRLNSILRELGFSNPEYLKSGLEMMIHGDGSNLSAGEKQLVSFARTLLHKKQFIILDEATANIDLKTEERIQNFIEKEFKESTMLVIAHRLQTIMNCDKILVLEHGQVVSFDTPSNLLSGSHNYFSKLIEKMQCNQELPASN